MPSGICRCTTSSRLASKNSGNAEPTLEDVNTLKIDRFLIPITTALIVLDMPSISHAVSSEMVAVSVVKPALDFFVNVMSFLFICRTVFSWYPNTDLRKFPYNVAVWPTEPLLEPVRGLIPPAFGVDVSAIVWVMILSFVREILTGQQGILTLIERG